MHEQVKTGQDIEKKVAFIFLLVTSPLYCNSMALSNEHGELILVRTAYRPVSYSKASHSRGGFTFFPFFNSPRGGTINVLALEISQFD